MCRYALVDFGLAQGTADTHIEMLKVVRQRASQKGGGSTGNQDPTQRSKAPPRLIPKSTTSASAALPLPAQQSTNLLPSSSSSSTTASSSAAQKALVKKARSVTTTVSTSRTKHAKVSSSHLLVFVGLFFVQWMLKSRHLVLLHFILSQLAEFLYGCIKACVYCTIWCYCIGLKLNSSIHVGFL